MSAALNLSESNPEVAARTINDNSQIDGRVTFMHEIGKSEQVQANSASILPFILAKYLLRG
jgi:hypothetical protein